MKFLAMLLIIFMIGCSSKKQTYTSATSSISKNKKGEFVLVVNRKGLDKINSGLEALKHPVTIEPGYTTDQLFVAIAFAAIVSFGSGFYIGRIK